MHFTGVRPQEDVSYVTVSYCGETIVDSGRWWNGMVDIRVGDWGSELVRCLVYKRRHTQANYLN